MDKAVNNTRSFLWVTVATAPAEREQPTVGRTPHPIVLANLAIASGLGRRTERTVWLPPDNAALATAL